MGQLKECNVFSAAAVLKYVRRNALTNENTYTTPSTEKVVDTYVGAAPEPKPVPKVEPAAEPAAEPKAEPKVVEEKAD